jgi:hypothetical protein
MNKIDKWITEKYNVKKERPDIYSSKLKKSSFTGGFALHVVISWYNSGFIDHKIYRINDSYVWTDAEEPLAILVFKSIDELMKVLRLPQFLKEEIEEL